MSTENTPGEPGPPPRRGPSVDLDPTGILTAKAPDRQRRQFLNYSFYRLDPGFRRLPAADRRAAGTEFIELMPGQGKFLFVYPFTKTRSWYRLSPHARQGMMDELAFDSDYPQEFVDLVGRLRYTEASLYTRSGTRRCSRARRRPSTPSSRSWRTWISDTASEEKLDVSSPGS